MKVVLISITLCLSLSVPVTVMAQYYDTYGATQNDQARIQNEWRERERRADQEYERKNFENEMRARQEDQRREQFRQQQIQQQREDYRRSNPGCQFQGGC